ncbi:cytochrome b/b6 domain-containing protein [Shewanella sp. AS1]|uniref:cytochrome b/b6 domain-containing protein n=1 Tax=Shewanella sp. AS1 TaxID=2907626 RepID=UPI001F2057E5|nr:cytochrome b/b6 domain-containing protein [Shewanella sp. AS1]MCE9677687.1 cytochrome b/b6 domain-containing protein [Shewanella sp. AS1]
MNKVTKFVRHLVDYQHLILIVLSLFLVATSGWILMGRGLSANASIWDLLHVYLGLIAACFSLSILVTSTIHGGWRQYYPYLTGDLSQVVSDLKGLAKGRIPAGGGKGLFSLIEGIGLLLLLGVSVTGLLWYLQQGSSDALMWRSWHHLFAQGFIGFLIVHSICAISHLLDFIRN